MHAKEKNLLAAPLVVDARVFPVDAAICFGNGPGFFMREKSFGQHASGVAVNDENAMLHETNVVVHAPESIVQAEGFVVDAQNRGVDTLEFFMHEKRRAQHETKRGVHDQG